MPEPHENHRTTRHAHNHKPPVTNIVAGVRLGAESGPHRRVVPSSEILDCSEV
jgi:hypothetical protein